MTYYKLPVSSLDALFARVAEQQTLYIPTDRDGHAVFAAYEAGLTLSKKLNTDRSAKDFFFPQTENLYDIKMKGKQLTVEDTREECADFTVFGVKGCDARSFSILDKVFLVDPVDTYYKNRREHGTIVSLACNRPEETCFCRAFSASPCLLPGITPDKELSALFSGVAAPYTGARRDIPVENRFECRVGIAVKAVDARLHSRSLHVAADRIGHIDRCRVPGISINAFVLIISFRHKQIEFLDRICRLCAIADIHVSAAGNGPAGYGVVFQFIIIRVKSKRPVHVVLHFRAGSL